MISIYYPHLPESSGAEAHRRGLLEGFQECKVQCVSRNQFSRFDSVRFVLDVLRGREPYIRMNANCSNVRLVVKVLHWLSRDYILEVNAPYQEDKSDVAFYERTVSKAKLVVCVSSVLKAFLLPYNRNVNVISNGGVMPIQEKRTEKDASNHFLFIYNAQWHWQSAENIERIAEELKSFDMTLKVVDVASCLKSDSFGANVKVVPALSREEYVTALEQATGFYLEYNPIQDPELGFYGDSLKFRDYWNTNKPILICGPKMHWAPNPQTPEFGVFRVQEFDAKQSVGCTRPWIRHSYSWSDACARLMKWI